MMKNEECVVLYCMSLCLRLFDMFSLLQGDTGVTGVVKFEQDGEDSPCVISFRVTGLTEGS